MRYQLLVMAFLAGLLPIGALAGGPDARLVDAHWQQSDPDSVQTVDHGAWAAFLARYLVQGDDGINRIRYGAVTTADKAALDAYVALLGAVPVSRLNRAAQMAFWLNLYNAVTVKIVIEAYPVDSIRDVLSGGWFAPGPWKRKLVSVEGRSLSLDDIEHGILRPIWQDSRIHYAVNCASLGCPNLAPRPYTAAALEDMLEQAAHDYINHPRGVTVTDKGKLRLSRLYDWYGEDFGGNDRSIIDHLDCYAEPALRTRLEGIDKIDGYTYDWALNDAP